MDLNTVTEVLVARDRTDLADPRPGDAFLAGGTALFGSPQVGTRRLVDLSGLGWPPLQVFPDRLEVAATCTIAQLRAAALPEMWASAAGLIEQCCHALLASFKIWNRGTVGGNLCLGFPAGAMISLAVAAEATALVWRPDGGEYSLPVVDFVVGDQRTALRPGEVLRSVTFDGAALDSRFALRKLALAPLGRSSAVIIGRLTPGSLRLTVTASSNRPYQLDLPAGGPPGDLVQRIDGTVGGDWVDDVYGAADWRRHITGVLARQVCEELA